MTMILPVSKAPWRGRAPRPALVQAPGVTPAVLLSGGGSLALAAIVLFFALRAAGLLTPYAMGMLPAFACFGGSIGCLGLLGLIARDWRRG